MAGAAAAGCEGEPWRLLGERLGEAFQVADDIRDVAASVEELGKPVGQDEALGRQSAVRELGLDGAVRRLDRLMVDAVGSMPACPGSAELRTLILRYGRHFLPGAWCAWRPEIVLHQLARSAPQEDGIEPVRSLYRPLADRTRPAPGQSAFRRWATAFPLTRPIARWRATALFDLGAGFVYAQVLAACVRLRLFDLLAEGPQTLAALAPRLGLAPDAAERLLAAAAALDLASRRSGGRFGLGPLGAAVVDNPGVAAMIEHHALLYADLADPVALLGGGG